MGPVKENHRRTRSLRAVAAGGVVLLTVTACTAGNDEDDAAASASPTSSDVESTSEPWVEIPDGFFVVEPDEQPLHSAGEILGLIPARFAVEDHDEFERLVVEFMPKLPSANSGDDSSAVELYVGAVTEPSHDGSGLPIEMQGTFILQISIPGTSPHFDPETGAWVAPPEAELLENSLIQDVVYDSFEGGAGLYVGLSSADTEYRISQDADHLLVYIDVRGRWT
jgi:hypothetical protein